MVKLIIGSTGDVELALNLYIIVQTNQFGEIQGFSGGNAITPGPNRCLHRVKLVKIPNHSLNYMVRQWLEYSNLRGWKPKPVNQKKRQQSISIATLMEFSQLSQWEHKFLTNMQGKQLPLRHQQQVLAQVAKSKLGGMQ